MFDKKSCDIKLTILLSNGTSATGSFNFENNKFEISKSIIFNESFYNCLNLESLSEKSATISYMFSTDYLPKKFKLTEDEPVEIVDYLDLLEPKLNNARVKIIIELKLLKSGGSSENERKRDFS